MTNFLQKITQKTGNNGTIRLSTAEVTGLGTNLLVISDLHLGEDLSEFGGLELSRLLAGLNNRLSAMLFYFTQNRWDNIPWELVLAGDTFDFLKDSLRPRAPEADPHWREQAVPRAQRLNTRETPEEIAAKVGQIGRAHAPIMESLVDFLLAGNTLVIISGNHDMELYFPQVQAAFTGLLTTTMLRLVHQRHQTEPTPEEVAIFQKRITFEKWFYARPGLCHLEHGHLGDLWCSVPNPLLPLSRLIPPLTATPFIQRAMPYVADLLPDFSSHGIETLSIPELLSSLHWKNRLGLARAILAAIHDLTLENPEESRLVAEKGAELAARQAGESVYSTQVWSQLFATIVPPMRLTLPRLLYEVAHPRNTGHELRHYAATISSICGAKVVLLGHSHQPEQLVLKDKKGRKFTYINSGSWVSREVIQGGDGQGQTFAIITPYSKKPAQLYQWLGLEELWDGRPYRPYSLYLDN